jgi:mono/diheme cytochrome c family protein
MRMTKVRIATACLVLSWVAGPALSQTERGGPETGAVNRGEAVYVYWCATCHAAGPGMPGTAALEAKYNGSLPAVLTERTDLTPETIAFYVRNGVSVMPPFRKTEVTDADLEALSEYVIGRSEND